MRTSLHCDYILAHVHSLKGGFRVNVYLVQQLVDGVTPAELVLSVFVCERIKVKGL